MCGSFSPIIVIGMQTEELAWAPIWRISNRWQYVVHTRISQCILRSRVFRSNWAEVRTQLFHWKKNLTTNDTRSLHCYTTESNWIHCKRFSECQISPECNYLALHFHYWIRKSNNRWLEPCKWFYSIGLLAQSHCHWLRCSISHSVTTASSKLILLNKIR